MFIPTTVSCLACTTSNSVILTDQSRGGFLYPKCDLCEIIWMWRDACRGKNYHGSSVESQGRASGREIARIQNSIIHSFQNNRKKELMAATYPSHPSYLGHHVHVTVQIPINTQHYQVVTGNCLWWREVTLGTQSWLERKLWTWRLKRETGGDDLLRFSNQDTCTHAPLFNWELRYVLS